MFLACTEKNSATPNDAYKWYLNGEEISGQRGQKLRINPDSDNKSGKYKCEATFYSAEAERAVKSKEFQFTVRHPGGKVIVI